MKGKRKSLNDERDNSKNSYDEKHKKLKNEKAEDRQDSKKIQLKLGNSTNSPVRIKTLRLIFPLFGII